VPFGWLAFVWLGGAMFVLSLACGALFFAVVLGRPAGGEPGAMRAGLFDTLLFSLFALHHSVMARSAVKRRVARFLPERSERSLYVWVASTLFLVVCLAWMPVPGMVWRLEGIWRWIAHGVQLVGLTFLAAGARVLDPLDLAGIRVVVEPAHPRAEQPEGTTFKTQGPYGVVRHPIYSGTILLMAAMPDMTGGRFLFTALTTLYIVLAIPWEERSLVQRYGDEYRDYRRAVPWRLVPKVF
jgi:methanethiol S-methyltransferase